MIKCGLHEDIVDWEEDRRRQTFTFSESFRLRHFCAHFVVELPKRLSACNSFVLNSRISNLESDERERCMIILSQIVSSESIECLLECFMLLE